MIKKFLFASLLLVVLPVFASHIVGGEFELIHISGYNYQLNMILYFDDINGNPGALDDTVRVGFYRKRDNFFVGSTLLRRISRTPVSYTQPACSNGLLKTDRIFYSTNIFLSPDVFNDSQGYYASWQRCCRNYTITNIYSDDPSIGGISAGQTFYMEFPPVIKDGVPFVNSSPHLFPPLSDYACPGRPYYVNFAGTDDDGDSIVYSLTTPLNTFSATALPPRQAGPYPEIQWRPTYSLSNIIHGSPDLRISPDGLLTCTATEVGLFVFAVKAEEFRGGLKIGETRRDFQMLVVDGCQPDKAPVITGKKLTDGAFSYVDNMSISFSNTTDDSQRCITVRVSDPDSQDPLHNNIQNVSIKVVPLNFRGKDVTGILPGVTTATLTNGSTKDFNICFPKCPFLNGAPYQIGIIAFDDACSLPLSDTLRVTVSQPMPPNANAYFLPQKITTAQLNEGSFGSWPYAAKDDDGDNLVLSLLTDGFALGDAGMNFKILNQQPGSVNGSLDWSAICKKFEFSKKTDFKIKVLVDDQDACNTIHFDTAIFDLKVLLPHIDPHVKVFNDANGQEATSSTITMNLGHLGLNVIGNDTEPSSIDTLNLSLLGIDGTSFSGYSFSSASGLHHVESKFLWDFNCSIFKNNIDSVNLKLKFLVANNHCKTPIEDTAFVNLIVKDIKSTDKDFAPANVITTYPDHCNDFFAIDGFASEPDCNGQVRNVPAAPVDNCSNRFERVKIYDRWGKQVFESNDRLFRWYASNESAGVYYYIIYFSKNHYKSSITVIH